MSKFCLLITAFAASVWGQTSCNSTGASIVRPCLNNSPSREFGQPALLPSLNSTAPNLVEGRELNQPFAVAFDTSVTPPIMYVVDEANSRVLAYQNPANLNPCGINNLTCGMATQVIGPRPRDFTTTFPGGPNAPSPAVTAGFNAPTSAAVDANGNLYVLDAGNNRILRFPAPFKQTGALWVTDLVIGQKSVASGTSPNQGLAAPSATSLFFSSGGTLFNSSLTIEPATGALWVTDPGNNRVLRFPTSQLAANTTLPQADLVIGQSNFTSQQVPTPPPNTLNQLVYTSLYEPSGITFDAKDRLYVSDGLSGQFYRVLWFNAAGSYATGMAASRILGLVFQLPSPAPTVTFPNQYQLLGPVGLAAYPGNNLWVCDVGNNRVVEYDVPENWPAVPSSTPGQAPTTGQISPPMLPAGVIGQPSLTATCPSNGCQNKGQPKPDNTTLATPVGLALNGTDLWIADTGNNRVLDFPQQSGGTYSAASHLAGQVDYPYNSPNLIEGREVYFPSASSIVNLPFAGGGIAIDHNSTPPHMYVADTANNRVLCFNNAYNNPTRADLVLGQTDLYSSLTNSPLNLTTTMTQSGLYVPTDVAVDANGNVWVADAGNGRVLRFPAPFSQPAGTQILPTVVLGQLGFTGTPITNASIETMDVPYGLAIFSDGSLAVSDAALNRTLIFKKTGSDFQNSQSASIVLGQTDFQSSTHSSTAAGLYSPRHMSVDTSDRLYIADAANNRMVVFNGANNLANGSASSLQVSFNAPQTVKVSPLTGFIWVSSTNSDQLYLLPEYDTLIIGQTPNGFPYYAQIPTQTPVIAIELDNADNMITSELANRVTFYYPAIAWQNVGNYNSQPLAPGQLALLYQYGAGFSFTSMGAQPPLPPKLGDVQILVNGTAAPIYELDPDAIAFQVPSSAPTSGTSSFVVLHPSTGQIIGTGNVPMAQFNPGFFAQGQGGVYGIGLLAAVNSTGGINGPSNPIKANCPTTPTNCNFISFYLTGGGAFPGIPDGQISSTLVNTIVQPQILSVDGWVGQAPSSQIQYSGNSFFPGVWQINYYVGNVYGPGNHVIAVLMNGISSNIGPSGTIQVYFVSN